MDKCWANALGACGKKLSREHLISKGILENREFSVKGFSWCKDSFKSVGAEALTRKCLCDVHNNSLSEVDTEGIKFFNLLDKIATLTSNTNNNSGEKVIESISGNLLERWFLKTLINFSYKSKYQLGLFGEVKGMPHIYLVDIVFGKVSFTQTLGLYSIVQEGQARISKGEIIVRPLIQNGKTIGGGVFSFRGIDFFLSLTPGIPPHKLGYLDIKGFPKHILDGILVYRSTKMDWSQNGIQQHRIDVVW